MVYFCDLEQNSIAKGNKPTTAELTAVRLSPSVSDLCFDFQEAAGTAHPVDEVSGELFEPVINC